MEISINGIDLREISMINKIVITTLLIMLGLNPVVAANISFITHSIEGKTFRDQNGELRGIKNAGRRAFQVELVREMMIKLKVTPRNHIIVPFKRGLKMIKLNRKPYAMFNTSKRPDRIGKMKFVGPLTHDIVYLYELKSNPSGIKTIEDAKNSGLCVNLGGNQDTFATNNGFSNIIRTDYEQCFKMLVRKRVRFATISHLDLFGVLKNANINPGIIHNTAVYMFKSEGSISFSNQVSDDVVNKWQSALDEIKTSGKYEELLKEYLYPK